MQLLCHAMAHDIVWHGITLHSTKVRVIALHAHSMAKAVLLLCGKRCETLTVDTLYLTWCRTAVCRQCACSVTAMKGIYALTEVETAAEEACAGGDDSAIGEDAGGELSPGGGGDGELSPDGGGGEEDG